MINNTPIDKCELCGEQHCGLCAAYLESYDDTIPASDKAWDTGELGSDELYVDVCPEDAELEKNINDSLDLVPVSIRLQKSLIAVTSEILKPEQGAHDG